MICIDYDWYEDGVLVEREDFDVNEHGPFEVDYGTEEEGEE
jgi:hypothetical protein